MLLKRIVLAVTKAFFGVRRDVRSFVLQTRLLFIVLVASLLVAGCVDYDLDVSFDSPNQGAIVQSIKLGEQFTALSPETAQEWLNSLERRAKQLEGKSKRISDSELRVTIPFYYGAEFEQKFNQFFNPTEKKKQQPGVESTDLPEIKSHLSLAQNNLLLLQRNRLSYDLDLRSLSLVSSDGSVQVDPGSLLDLEFHLNTPWGARSLNQGQNTIISPENPKDKHHLVWKLQPGKINHLEAVFWLPNPLGIGTVVIAIFVAAGINLKYNVRVGSKTADFSATIKI